MLSLIPVLFGLWIYLRDYAVLDTKYSDDELKESQIEGSEGEDRQAN